LDGVFFARYWHLLDLSVVGSVRYSFWWSIGSICSIEDSMNERPERPSTKDIDSILEQLDSTAAEWQADQLKRRGVPGISIFHTAGNVIRALRAVPFPPEKAIQDLLSHVGEDPRREGLQETPKRYLAALKFWTSGYNQDPKEVLKVFEDGSEGYDEMVFQGNIALWSTCMHHIAPFFGVAHVAYIPSGKIVGLSKLSRLVDIFARRLTVQEKITTQVADALEEHLQARGVGVMLQCRHTCIESRGVQKAGSITTTSALRGLFKQSDARSEFMSMVAAVQGVKTL
jgi:GTP cyclohydrolase I